MTLEIVELTTNSIEVTEINAPIVVVDNPTVEFVELGIQGPPGVPGASGSGSAITHTFSWGDAVPAYITSVPAGKTVFKVEVIVLTPFDQPPTITIGDFGSSNRLVDSIQVDATTAGTYQTNPDYVYTSITDVNLYMTLASGTSAGNGIILIYIQG